MLVPVKDQVILFWSKQTRPQRITLVALTLAACIIIPLLLIWASKPTYQIAYRGLSETDAGQIVQKLDETGVDYQLQDNGTIMVQADQVYPVRLKMARDGLPQTSTVGYELFSGNTLGMTEFTQRINYQRALEGELERTISSLSPVEMVRVHVVTPEKALLTEQQEPATASITVKQRVGQNLDTGQVKAITNLVASSVEGLKAENVTIIDTEGNLLTSLQGEDGLDSVSQQTDNQRMAETAASNEIKKRVSSMLDKVLGPNRYAVQASVMLDWNQKEVTSSSFNPTPAAVRSSNEIHEEYNTNGAIEGGVPGAGTNLPTPLPNITAEPGMYNYLRDEKTYNYEVSQIDTVEKITPGQVKRISVSVLVDGVTDAQQIASIQNAAAAAAGIDAQRGDAIVVASMGFDRTYYENQAEDLSKTTATNQYIQWGLIGAAVLLFIILMSFFLASLRRMRQGSVESWRPVFKPVGELALQQAGAGAAALPLSQPFGMPALEQQSQLHMLFSQQEPQASLNLPPQKTDEEILAEFNNRSMNQPFPEDEQRSRIVQRLAEENPATVAEIIQIWLTEDERKNG